LPLHADPTEADTLATAWQTLLNAVLSTWTETPALNVPALVTFAESMLRALPSSSHDTSPSSSNTQAFSELLVDAIWAADSQLDDILVDAKAAIAAAEASGGEGLGEAQKLKTRLEKDKEILVEVVKRLLVRSFFYYLFGICVSMNIILLLRCYMLRRRVHVGKLASAMVPADCFNVSGAFFCLCRTMFHSPYCSQTHMNSVRIF
jgi:hypothetical protein